MNTLFYAAAAIAGILLLVFIFTSLESFRIKRQMISLKTRQERRQTYLNSKSQHHIVSGSIPGYNEGFSSEKLVNTLYVNANTLELWRISNPAIKISLEPRIVQIPQYVNTKF